MVRTQVQLPDRLYEQLRNLAAEREWSLAEAIRRGAELVVLSYPSVRARADTWSLPEPLPLGTFLAPVESWRELANSRES